MNQTEYEGLKKERDVVAQTFNLLLNGQFSGREAQAVLICQMYMQGLTQRLDAEIKRQAPANEPLSKEELGGVVPLADVKLPDPNGDVAVANAKA